MTNTMVRAAPESKPMKASVSRLKPMPVIRRQ